MTTIILVFFIAFLLSLLLTPVVIRIAKRCNIVDLPMDRKIHDLPVPRLGGVVLFLSFFTSVTLLTLNKAMFLDVVSVDQRVPLLLVALTSSFFLGLWDDIRHLTTGIKFAGQVGIGVFSYYAGIKINVISLPFSDFVNLGYLALPVTVFWFVLAINAVNLIDGLDGLAAGISLFVSITMLVICLTSGKLLEAIAFAALAGALIGFLHYNFNPAKIFMGDGGSYFLGYSIAALSILGSIKGQVATAILIPIIALGVPMIDTFFTPVRRFLLGHKLFQPDRSHLHHRLIEMGYSHRRAVLVLYGLTIVLGIVSIVMVHARDETAALILMVIGLGIIFLGRYCGVLDFFNTTRFGRWLKDLSYETGLNRERRIFLDRQMAIARSDNLNSFWEEVGKTLQHLEFDLAELAMGETSGGNMTCAVDDRSGEVGCLAGRASGKGFDGYGVCLTWSRNGARAQDLLNEPGLLKIEQPLLGGQSTPRHYGTFFLVKDVRGKDISLSTFKRLEHLRRVMGDKLAEIIG